MSTLESDISSTAQHFQAIILSYVTSNNELTQTVASLTDPINKAYASSNPQTGALLQTLWTELFNTAQQTPLPSYTSGAGNTTNLTYITRVVDLVEALRQLASPPPPNTVSNADDLWPITDQTPLWSTLPGLGVTARDRFNIDPSSVSPSSFTNLCTFLALIFSRYSHDPPAGLDFTLYPLWTLRLSLESPQDPATLANLISATASWVAIPQSRAAIHRLCVEGKSWTPDPKTGAPAKSGPLWDQAGKERVDGYGLERWSFWKGRLDEVAVALEGEAGETARRAAENMAKEGS